MGQKPDQLYHLKMTCIRQNLTFLICLLKLGSNVSFELINGAANSLPRAAHERGLSRVRLQTFWYFSAAS